MNKERVIKAVFGNSVKYGVALLSAALLLGLALGTDCDIKSGSFVFAPRLVCCAAFVPVLWALSTTRVMAFLCMFVYYLAAARGVVPGAAVFFSVFYKKSYLLFLGIILWSAASFVLSLPWAFFWRDFDEKVKYIGKRFCFAYFAVVACQIVLIVPPVGLIGWCNPLSVTGYVFPYTGIFGMLLLCAVWAAVLAVRPVLIENRKMLVRTATVFLFLLCVTVGVSCLKMSRYSDAFKGYSTRFGLLCSGMGSNDAMAAFQRFRELREFVYNEENKCAETHRKMPLVAVFPETVAGFWGDCTKDIYSNITSDFVSQKRIAVIGAEDFWGTYYHNCLIVCGNEYNVYKQRITVPVAMCRPWRRDGTHCKCDFWSNGILNIAGHRCAMLICYEAYLMLPMVVSGLFNPDVIICGSNSWWYKGGSLVTASDQLVEGWGRLFNATAVTARNY